MNILRWWDVAVTISMNKWLLLWNVFRCEWFALNERNDAFPWANLSQWIDNMHTSVYFWIIFFFNNFWFTPWWSSFFAASAINVILSVGIFHHDIANGIKRIYLLFLFEIMQLGPGLIAKIYRYSIDLYANVFQTQKLIRKCRFCRGFDWQHFFILYWIEFCCI